MKKRGGLLIPFSLVLSMLALLLGALYGNYMGRKDQVVGKTSPLDVYTAPVPTPDLQNQK
jgi:hypothetical protein